MVSHGLKASCSLLGLWKNADKFSTVNEVVIGDSQSERLTLEKAKTSWNIK